MQRLALCLAVLFLTLSPAKSVKDESKPAHEPRCGECPPAPEYTGDMDVCTDTCKSDCDCPGVLKCCPNGCGNTCRAPVFKRKCPDKDCNNKTCTYGFKYDDNGCQTCACYDPCKGHRCQDGEICEPVKCRCDQPPCIPSSNPSCVKEPKPKVGRCPICDVVPDEDSCEDECKSDCDCPGESKCCAGVRGRSCQRPEKPRPCPDRHCKRRCPYGFKYDEQGCQLCSCYDPCKGHECGEGEICEPEMDNCVEPPCIPASKPKCVPKPKPKCGTCPTYDGPTDEGDDHCKADCDCPGESKCCRCERGRRCREPERPRPCPDRHCNNRTCPYGFKYDTRGCQLCACYDPCKGYKECGKGEICEPVIRMCDEPPCIPASEPSCVPASKPKPGYCPKPKLYVSAGKKCYDDECKDDCDCPGELKCCQTGRGRKCLPPECTFVCPQVRCSKECPYGFKCTDNGCQTCACHDPCRNFMCKDGTVCERVMQLCINPPCCPPSVAVCVPEHRCEGGQVWNNCGSPCTATCCNPTPVCIERCEPRCECPRELPIWHDGRCIALDECPAEEYKEDMAE